MNVADKDYKDTLNLPETDFPMQASLAQRRARLSDRRGRLSADKLALFTQRLQGTSDEQ